MTLELKAHNLQDALNGITAQTVATSEEDEAAFPRLGSFDAGAVYVGRFAGESPWERHTTADELLHILEGQTEITILTPEGPETVLAKAGSVFVVPKGLWHRQVANPSVTLVAVTPDDTQVSEAADPR